MAFDVSGNFTRLRNWVADAAAGIKIVASLHDSEDDGFATAFNLAFLRDGRAPATGNFKMNTNKIGGLGQATLAGDALMWGGDAGRPSAIDLTNATNGYPIGGIAIWPTTTPPLGFILCNGQAVPRATYPKLWLIAQASIANGDTTFGPGDGATTFNVPNLTSKFPFGAGGGGTLPGITGGLAVSNITIATHVLDITEAPYHDHDFAQPPHTHPGSTIGNHTHGISIAGSSVYANTGAAFGLGGGGSYTGYSPAGLNTTDYINGGSSAANIAGDYAVTVFNGKGGNVAHGHPGSTQDTNLPPYVSVYFIIKT